MYAACRAGRQGRYHHKEEEDEWLSQYRWYILFIVLFICVDSPCSIVIIIIIILIVDPSDCQSPSTMVDYSLCVRCLSRCYVRLLLSQQGKMWGTICHVSHRFRCDVPSGVEEATVTCRLSTKGGDCVTVVPGIHARSARKKSHL